MITESMKAVEMEGFVLMRKSIKKAAFLLSLIVLTLLCSAIASGAPLSRDAYRGLLLSAEVAILRAVDDLDLTKDQLNELIPIFKELAAARGKAAGELEALLLREKDLLLKGEMDEEKNEELTFERRIVMRDMRLSAAKAKSEAVKLLSLDQVKKIRTSAAERMARRRMLLGRRIMKRNQSELSDQGAASRIDPEIAKKIVKRARERMAERITEGTGEKTMEKTREKIVKRFAEFREKQVERSSLAAPLMKGRGLDFIIRVLEEKLAAM